MTMRVTDRGAPSLLAGKDPRTARTMTAAFGEHYDNIVGLGHPRFCSVARGAGVRQIDRGAWHRERRGGGEGDERLVEKLCQGDRAVGIGCAGSGVGRAATGVRQPNHPPAFGTNRSRIRSFTVTRRGSPKMSGTAPKIAAAGNGCHGFRHPACGYAIMRLCDCATSGGGTRGAVRPSHAVGFGLTRSRMRSFTVTRRGVRR